MDLFDNESPDDADAGGAPISGAADGENARAPLADRMRPRTLDEFFGQEEIVGEGAPLRRLIEGDSLRSMIFWGPPGTGKTTLATIIARQTRSEYLSLSAVTASIKDAKAIMQRARLFFRNQGRRTVLFIDEIHRFNKAQQDAFLPFVEGRLNHPRRRHHGESVVFGHRRAHVALQDFRPQSARRGPPRAHP